MKNVAIITARGGSKRIPRKNIKSFLGKPIIAYTIQSALSSGLFSEVMVSTDDEEIAKIARAHGANVPFMRSAKTSDDYATTNDVVKEVILTYQSLGQSFDYGCCMYPTAPFITDHILKLAYDVVITNQYDLVLPIAPFSFPVQRSYIISENQNLKYAYPEFMNSRSQDLTKHYHDAGQFYFFNVNKYLDRNKLEGESMFGIELDELRVQDIDNETDWKLAEMKYSLIINDRK